MLWFSLLIYCVVNILNSSKSTTTNCFAVPDRTDLAVQYNNLYKIQGKAINIKQYKLEE